MAVTRIGRTDLAKRKDGPFIQLIAQMFSTVGTRPVMGSRFDVPGLGRLHADTSPGVPVIPDVRVPSGPSRPACFADWVLVPMGGALVFFRERKHPSPSRSNLHR